MDYLLIDFRAVDGRLGVYPLRIGFAPERVPWAALGMYNLAVDVESIPLDDYESANDQAIRSAYAKRLVESARRVDLARLAERDDGVLLRLVAYAEDGKPPFFEERIMPS